MQVECCAGNRRVCGEGWPPVIDYNGLVHLWAHGYGTEMSTDPTIDTGLHAQAGRICHATDYQYLITGQTFTLPAVNTILCYQSVFESPLYNFSNVDF